jgi:alkylated DNA nucleotide flippase Atl1
MGCPRIARLITLVKARFSPDVNQGWYRLLRMLGTKYRSKISQNIPKEAKKHFVQPNTD